MQSYKCDELGGKEEDMTTLKVVLLEDLIGNHENG